MAPGSSGREARRSSKKLLPASGLYFGWSCMSCRQEATSSVSGNRTTARLDLPRNFAYLPRSQTFEKFSRGLGVELRIVRFDAEEEAVARRSAETIHIENRMVRHRQAIQAEHAQDGRKRCEKDRHLKRHR